MARLRLPPPALSGFRRASDVPRLRIADGRGRRRANARPARVHPARPTRRPLVDRTPAPPPPVDYRGMGDSPYRFRLERIRALRERHEDEAKLQLANAMQEQHRVEQQLDSVRQDIVTARRAQQDTGTTSAQDLMARQAYLERIEQAHRSGLEDLRKQKGAVADRRAELTQAAQDRQALERLKTKGLAAHQAEAERVANAALDEIATNGYRRRAA